MIRIFLIASLLLLGSRSIAQKNLDLADCFQYFRFYPQTAVNLRFAHDGRHYLEKTRGGIALMDVAGNKQVDLLIPHDTIRQIGEWDDYQVDSAHTRFLFRTNSQALYRHSVLAAYWIYDRTSGKLERLHESNAVQFAALSPDARKVAFVLQNNLYIRDIDSGSITPVTTDGAENRIINGLPDWVYEEEFSPVDGNGMVATSWSPDSKHLAYIRFDESAVREVAMAHFEQAPYPRYKTFKYPKVGEQNAGVSVHLYDAVDNRYAGELTGLESDDYVPRLHWTADNILVATRLNRLQDTLELLLALPERAIPDPQEQKIWIPTRLLHRETDPAYVEVHDNLQFLKDAVHYTWTSERDGYLHLYLHQIGEPDSIRQLTRGAFDVTNFYGVDERNGTFYYQTATPTPMDRQLWEGYLDGRTARLLKEGAGTHEAGFSPDFEFFIHAWSDADTPPVSSLCNRAGDNLRSFYDNRRVQARLDEYGFVHKIFWQFPLSDGTVLNGWMLRPDSLEPGRRYPVLFDIYGGPGSQTVLNAYDGYTDPWRQLLVREGIIVVSVDNRGTGGRGRDFKKCTQLQLGKLETEDQIAAARYLSTLPYVDSARISIWGWSYGGFLSTSCILKGRETFKSAIAVAPVTNWKWYDSAYTERYMHTTRDNPAGYEENSPVNFAGMLRGGNYLICHGTTDDNVHWQQTVEMVNALIHANKQFETHFYPNRNHGIYGDNATLHLFSRMTAFILGDLKI